jgi:Zn-dependent protease with chaperone function
MNPRWPLILGVAAVLAGCAANPMTGRSQLMLVSEDSVIAQAKLAYSQELGPWDKKGKLNTDPRIKTRIDTITGRLVAQAIRYRPETAKWDWQVSVIDEPKTLNAFCLPGGRMAIYTGLMEKLQATDDEIAQVMGHEIAHALANHGAEKMSQAMATQGVVGVAAVLAGGKNSDLVMTGGTALAQLGWLLPNSRSAETEADRIGIELAARAGYDPKAGASLWKKMMAANGGGGPAWLSTHPSSEKRMQELAQLADYMQPLYAEAKAGPLPSYTRLAGSGRELGSGSQQLAASGLKPLTLVSPAFEDFKRGQARLGCGNDCAIKFQNEKDDLKKLHAQRNWEGLARTVLDIGYRQDIAWHYLGLAAEGLGYPAVARQYYGQAVEAAKRPETHCEGSIFNLCNGIRLPAEAETALSRLGSR